MADEKIVLMVGTPADGFSVIGPFEDAEEATEYAEDFKGKDWWIMKVQAP